MAALKVKLPPVRSVMLTTGLVMFTCAACHFLSHAIGIVLVIVRPSAPSAHL